MASLGLILVNKDWALDVTLDPCKVDIVQTRLHLLKRLNPFVQCGAGRLNRLILLHLAAFGLQNQIIRLVKRLVDFKILALNRHFLR